MYDTPQSINARNRQKQGIYYKAGNIFICGCTNKKFEVELVFGFGH